MAPLEVSVTLGVFLAHLLADADDRGEETLRPVVLGLETTRLGPVSLGNAAALLSAVGEFNPKTGSWRVPEMR